MPMRPAIHSYNWIPWAHGLGETLDIERVLGEAAEAFAEFAATLGMDTTFHNHLDTNLETPAQIDDIIPRLRRCGFCLDTGHLIAAGGDPVACTRHYGKRIRHVHFKDTAFTPDGRFAEFVELGAGTTPTA